MGRWIHRLSSIDEQKKIATCSNCGVVDIYRKAHEKGVVRWHCKEKRRSERRKEKYGLDEAGYFKMCSDRSNRCDICGDSFFPLHVDHCHGTMEIRGLLCLNCNLVLGHAKDRVDILEKAVAYLRKQS